ncbi:hypothetical protein FG152_24705 [Ochrobactrum sp. XJ1]|nr:hypothetical protein [Ochrobactrum sp. XJ1]
MRNRSNAIDVFDTPSGLGGSHTVSIVCEIDAMTVDVRVWYGRATSHGWEAWKDWDGYQFRTTRDQLTNPRKMLLWKR